MGKKGTQKPSEQKADSTKADSKMNNSTDDAVSQLKQSVDRLAAGVEKMGITLGVAPNRPVTQKKKEDTVTPAENTNGATDAHERPNMTAEEKKQQRAQKAAEKKARAEAAAAKKAAGGSAPNTGGKAQPNEKKQQPKQKAASQEKEDVGKKSALRNGKEQAQRIDGKEVKFDLSANMVKSTSEENLVANIQMASERAIASEASAVEDSQCLSLIHPAFLRLAVCCEQELISELDQLCQQFILAFKEFLTDWSAQRTAEKADVTAAGRDLDVAIRPQLAHLTRDGRWPLPLALGNIVRQMKKEILKLGTTEEDVILSVKHLQSWLDDCLEANFSLAYTAISDHLKTKMHATPSIITYDWCPIVNSVLLDAISTGTKQSFTVVDAEMNGPGIRHVRSFIEQGVRCRYTDLKSVGSAMQSCSMVLLGCSAVLSNGCVAAPRGSLQLALIAKAFNVPILVTAQSFKFVDKVQSYGRMALLSRDSIELVPSDLVTAVVTDIRILPPSSAPAVLKAKALDME